MEALKLTLYDYIPFWRGSGDPKVVQAVNHLFNSSGVKVPSELERLNRGSNIGVFQWDRYPGYVIKIEVPSKLRMLTYCHVAEDKRPVEENSLKLRVRISRQMRRIIEEENLDRLYVPKKWAFSQGVIGEKLDLYSWDETGRKIKDMTPDEQKGVVSQIWKIVYLTGNQDLPRNFLMMRDGRIAFFDTEPYGTTLHETDTLRPHATLNFLNEPFFSYKLKAEVIQDFFK